MLIEVDVVDLKSAVSFQKTSEKRMAFYGVNMNDYKDIKVVEMMEPLVKEESDDERILSSEIPSSDIQEILHSFEPILTSETSFNTSALKRQKLEPASDIILSSEPNIITSDK